MKYALLIYGSIEIRDRTSDDERRRINAGVAEVVSRPNVTSYLRLQQVELATTVRDEQGTSLITDGPFVDSKDFLGGLIVVEAANLDGALAVADELQALRFGGSIEIRPVNEEPLVGARAGLPRRLGPGRGIARGLSRRHRTRRGGRSGGVRNRCRTLAARRRAREPDGLADQDRSQSSDRPHPARADPGRGRPQGSSDSCRTDRTR